MTAKIAGLALRPARKAPMAPLETVEITGDSGLVGDHAGKHPDRLVTVLAAEAWRAALDALDPPLSDDDSLPWTVRRANILTKGADLPRAAGGLIQLGPVILEVTGQTWPCKRMEEARPGLLKALARDWRGGVTCRVAEPGTVSVGDAVAVLNSPPEIVRKLP